MRAGRGETVAAAQRATASSAAERRYDIGTTLISDEGSRCQFQSRAARFPLEEWLAFVAALAVCAVTLLTTRRADAGPEPILGVPPESALLVCLGLTYALALGYVVVCRLLEPRMKAVLAVLGIWGASAVPVALARGQTLWDLVLRKTSMTAGANHAYLDPTFVGVNAFLICVLGSGLFELFAGLIQRQWRRVAAVMATVLALFAAERYVLDRYDARGLASFRTVVRDAVRVPQEARAR